jgi:hypothetical protein
MRIFGESGICKTGAKSVVAAGVSELGLGIALKAQDETKRAVEVALNFILHEIVLKPKDPNFRIEQLSINIMTCILVMYGRLFNAHFFQNSRKKFCSNLVPICLDRHLHSFHIRRTKVN